MRSVTSLLVLIVVTALAGAGCDLAPRDTSDPAREQWEALAPQLRERVSTLRSRQTVLGGRVAALTVPPGVEDAALAAQISDLQGRVSELEGAIAGFEETVNQTTGEIETAFDRKDKLAARRLVELAAQRVDQAFAAASASFDAIEQRLPQAESSASRYLAMMAAEDQRLLRVAGEGGDYAVRVKWLGDVIDLADAGTKATFDRLVKLGGSCDQLRLTVSASADERADDVAKKMVMAGVPADRVTADEDKQLPADGLEVTVTAPCLPPAPAPAAAAADPVPPPPPGAAARLAVPAPPVAERRPAAPAPAPAPAPGHEGHGH